MGNAEDTDELTGKRGSGNTLNGAAKGTASAKRSRPTERRAAFLVLADGTKCKMN